MRTSWQKLVQEKRKLTKSTSDSKAMADDPDKNDIDKIKVQKSKLELHIQEFQSIVKELENKNNGNIDKTQLEREFEELDELKDAAQMLLIELNNKLEKEERLWKEQLEREERLQNNNWKMKRNCEENKWN